MSSRFNVENFDPSPDEELVCSICRCVFDDPMECPCRHIFCRGCISNWLELKSSCPICRKRVYTLDLQPVVPLIKNMIAKLMLVCPNRENGCKLKTNLENYNNHVSRCLHELISCKNKNCPQTILRKDEQKHEEVDCEFRMILCQRECNLMLPSAKVKHHNCVKELKKQLEESLKREESLNKHIEEITNELNTFKKQFTESRNNNNSDNSYHFFEPIRHSTLATSDDSSSTFDSIFSSDSDDSDDNFVSDSTPSLLRNLRSRLSRLDTLMSSFVYPSESSARTEGNATNNSEPRTTNEISLEITSDIENNFSAVQSAEPTSQEASSYSLPLFMSTLDNDQTESLDARADSGDNLNVQENSEVDEDFPTAAQCRILKRKRAASILSPTSDSDSDSSGIVARSRRVRSNFQNETAAMSLGDTTSSDESPHQRMPTKPTRNKKNQRNANRPHNQRFPRSRVPIAMSIIPASDTTMSNASTSSSSSDSSSSTPRLSGLGRTCELLELFSVETDPDWDPSMENVPSEGEDLPPIRTIPAASILDSMLDNEEMGNESDLDTSDSNYEVLVPERTYDLLCRYADEDSDEDEEWKP